MYAHLVKMKTFGVQFKEIVKTLFPRIGCSKRCSFAKAHTSDPLHYREIILKMGEGVEARQLRVAFNLTLKKTVSSPQYILA